MGLYCFVSVFLFFFILRFLSPSLANSSHSRSQSSGIKISFYLFFFLLFYFTRDYFGHYSFSHYRKKNHYKLIIRFINHIKNEKREERGTLI